MYIDKNTATKNEKLLYDVLNKMFYLNTLV